MHSVNLDHALLTLDYDEIIALAQMYERWALTGDGITPEERTKLIQWSSDYERIAAFAGPGWSAPKHDPSDPIVFVARSEFRAKKGAG